MFDIIYYETAIGNCPVEEFINSLEPKFKAKTFRTISLLESNGNKLGMPFSCHLDDGIFELRTQFSNNISRVLYFFLDGDRAVLTHGFIKKTQKTPPEEITKAKKYRKDYISRLEDNHETI